MEFAILKYGTEIGGSAPKPPRFFKGMRGSSGYSNGEKWGSRLRLPPVRIPVATSSGYPSTGRSSALPVSVSPDRRENGRFVLFCQRVWMQCTSPEKSFRGLPLSDFLRQGDIQVPWKNQLLLQHPSHRKKGGEITIAQVFRTSG